MNNTNHSARKYMMQTLNDGEILPSHMWISDHKNVQSIINYRSVNKPSTTQEDAKHTKWY